MITFFILAARVALFRHSCRANNKWRYLPTDSSFWVTLITVVWNHCHKAVLSLYSIWQMCVNRPVTYASLFGFGNWGPQSCERLVSPPVLWILPLLHPLSLFALLLYSHSHSFKLSLMVLSFQNINILKNPLPWKITYPHFHFLLSSLSPSFHGEVTWMNIIYLFLSSLPHLPLVLSPWHYRSGNY